MAIFDYILLDEVQDLSRNRYMLVRAILENNPNCRLFAAGDDWQAIYRFAGSNLSLIRNFEQNFKRYTRRSVIESTHRFGQPAAKISSGFIRANPCQSRKKAQPSNSRAKTPIEIVLNHPRAPDDDTQGLLRILQSLQTLYSLTQLRAMSFQIISRYNRDFKRLHAVTNLRIDRTRQVVY